MIKQKNFLTPVILLIIFSKLIFSSVFSSSLGSIITKYAIAYILESILIILLIYFFSIKYDFHYFKERKKYTPITWFFLLIFCFICGISLNYLSQWVVILFPDLVKNYDFSVLSNVYKEPFFIIRGILIAPIQEEVLIRGVVFYQCEKRISTKAAIIYTAFLWGICHLNLYQFLYAFLTGLIIGYIYSKTRSLFCVIMIHIANNAAKLIIPYKVAQMSVKKYLFIVNEISIAIVLTVFAGLIVAISLICLKRILHSHEL
jgi:membrane protease YdiL (CAAX protease family)